MSVDQPETPSAELRDLSLEDIDPNPGNPRLIFPQEELDKLAESISLEGVLVPVVVYEAEGRYVLVDGERRYKCALQLGLPTIPAIITQEREEKDLLLQMFNIHLIREPWRDLPTAKALGRLLSALDAAGRTDVSDGDLRDMTGMSVERIRQLRFALNLPEEWQAHIEQGEITLNWFWELDKNVIRPLAKERPKLLAELGENEIRQAFVDKRLEGVTASDSVSFRKVRPIIGAAGRDAEESADEDSVFDDTIRDLVKNPESTIDDAYEDSVQMMVEADKLARRTQSMVSSFERLISRSKSDDEKDQVVQIGRDLIASLTEVLDKA